MPKLGMDRFIFFIANITSSRQVTVNCFLFEIDENSRLPVLKGELNVLRDNSPFRLNESILQEVYDGAESFNDMEAYEMERSKSITENKITQSYGTDLIVSESKRDECAEEKDHGNKRKRSILNESNNEDKDTNTETKPNVQPKSRHDEGRTSQRNGHDEKCYPRKTVIPV